MADDLYYIVECPHCLEDIVIYKNEVNCGIFRHGVYRSSLQPIPPHLGREECDRLFNNEEIYGCSKPFKVIKKESIDGLEVCVCDYI